MSGWSARELLDKALKRRAELRLEAEALDSLIQTYHALLKIEPEPAPLVEEQPDLYQTPTLRMTHAARVTQMLDEARKIIIFEMRPMKRGEIVQRLMAQGMEILGSDKNKVFGTNLWRSGKFIMIEGRGYWPRDVELPEDQKPTLL